jgi:hypothetical protein
MPAVVSKRGGLMIEAEFKIIKYNVRFSPSNFVYEDTRKKWLTISGSVLATWWRRKPTQETEIGKKKKALTQIETE